MTSKKDNGAATGNNTLAINPFKGIKLLELESAQFLIELLPKIKKFNGRRSINHYEMALNLNINSSDLIESISVAIENSDKETADIIFGQLDHMFKSEVLITNGEVLNLGVYNLLSVNPGELLKYYMYHYKKMNNFNDTDDHEKSAYLFLNHLPGFIESIPVNVKREMFTEISIKTLYLISIFEIDTNYYEFEDEKVENLKLFNLLRSNIPLPIEYPFLNTLQEYAPVKFKELVDELQNPDLEFYRNMLFQGKQYESHKEFMESDDDLTNNEDVLGKLFN